MKNSETIMQYMLLVLCFSINACIQNKEKQKAARERLKGYFDKKENMWICEDPAYEASTFSDSLSEYTSVMKLDSDREPLAIGLINREGEIMVPIVYDRVNVGFTDGVCLVGKDNKLGLVNIAGEEIVIPQYEYISDKAIDSLLRVGVNDLYGAINLKGEIVIPLEYPDVTLVNEGLVAVMIEPQRWGYVNQKNQMVIEPEFTFVEAFTDGKVVLQKADGEDYIVFKNGKVRKSESLAFP